MQNHCVAGVLCGVRPDGPVRLDHGLGANYSRIQLSQAGQLDRHDHDDGLTAAEREEFR